LETTSDIIRVDVPQSRWEEFEQLLSERNVANTLIRVSPLFWHYELLADPGEVDNVIALLQAYQRRQIINSYNTH
jgi:hypothetical protein